MCSSTTSHKNQFSRRLDNKNNCYRELKIETFIEQNLSELNGELEKNQPKRFSLPCGSKTKELLRRK